MINWQVRMKNKVFWLTIIPMVLLLIQAVAAVFGFEIDLGELGNRLLDVVNAAFGVLAALGIVVDHTTSGVSDSKQAMAYVEPKREEVDHTTSGVSDSKQAMVYVEPKREE